MPVNLPDVFASPSNTIMLFQLLFSISESNISTCVWRRYHFFLRSFGFMIVMAWYIGAANTTRPLHGPFVNFIEVLRLLSISYTVFVLVFSGPCIRGFTRMLYGLTLGTLFLGFLSTVIITSVITSINQQRLYSHSMNLLHNRRFVTILWFVALVFMRIIREPLLLTVS
ncbi:TPA: hypothetical protein N0F65_009658 [Lagenidium giganteum]|uniref:Uncharacterized protein n=1 Tax=Lagenidium giganteum TaxID=4803 RepID=A0AAV2YIA2_9STRA|nr:TPA: hypothetical protein N0F65_009658 [Lagenidium giganteum]